MLNGSPTDNNATLFKAGYDSVINPKFKSGEWTEVADQSVPDWDNQKALTIFEQMLQKAYNKVDGVLAANDGLGNAAISALKQRKLKQIPVTGQDATLQGIQNIVNGDQCMTVYKAIKKEADAAAALAIALAKGESPTGVTGSVNNENRDVPSVLLKPVAVTKDNIKDYLGEPDFPKKEEICAGKVAASARRRVVMTTVTDGGGPRERPSGAVPLLELKGVSKRFGAVQALHEVDFEVREGEVTALVGDNGAGKSVTIKCIAGIYPIDEGEILWEGKPVTIAARRTPRRSGSRSSTRTSRWPTTSTSCRTCTSAARSSRPSARSTRRRWSGAARRR